MPIVRDEKGRITKGQVLNPEGISPLKGDKQALTLVQEYFTGQNWVDLIASWQWLIDHHNYRAVELALAYKLGKPVQTVDLNSDAALAITVTHVGDVMPGLLNSGDDEGEKGRITKGQVLNPEGISPLKGDKQALTLVQEYFTGQNWVDLIASWQWLIDHHNYRAVELALAYKLGKPVQTVDLNSDAALAITVTHVGDVMPGLLNSGDDEGEKVGGGVGRGVGWQANIVSDDDVVAPPAKIVKITEESGDDVIDGEVVVKDG